MPNPTALQAAAAAEVDEKTKKKAGGLIASALALLGLEAKPSAKMRKVTETTKHVKMEESDSGAEEEEEAGTGSTGSESEEEEEGSTGSTGTDGESTGSTGSESEEEEEEERGAAPKGKKGAKMEEEEEEVALARAVASAYRSPAVHDAFLAALPKPLRDVGAIYSPRRLSAAARKATGTKSTAAAMSAFSTDAKRGAAASATVIRKLAKVEGGLRKVRSDNRKARVDAIVAVAKSNGKAASKDLRAELRAFGMANGSEKLSKLIATLPAVATSPRLPKTDEKGDPIGAPGRDEQTKVMESIFAGMPPEERAKAEADYAKRMNGSAPAAPRS